MERFFFQLLGNLKVKIIVEAVVRECSVKKALFLSQYSQEKALKPATLLKGDSNTGVFL